MKKKMQDEEGEEPEEEEDTEEPEEEKEEKTEKPKDKWEVRLVIVDETQPPKKVLVKGEKTLDEWGYMAVNLNNQERILKAIE